MKGKTLGYFYKTHWTIAAHDPTCIGGAMKVSSGINRDWHAKSDKFTGEKIFYRTPHVEQIFKPLAAIRLKLTLSNYLNFYLYKIKQEMKQLFSIRTALLLLGLFPSGFIIMSIGCNDTQQPKKFTASAPDTVKTWVTFVSPRSWITDFGIQQSAYTQPVFKIRKDTAVMSSIDSTTAKLVWRRDSFYIVEVPVPLFDSVTRKQLFDSLHRPYLRNIPVPLVDSFVLKDFNTHIGL